MTENSMKRWIDDLPQYLHDGKEHFSFIIHGQTEVGYGWDNDVDLDYCMEHGIIAYNQNRNGGAIVCSKGNIGLAFIYENRKYKKPMLASMLSDLKDHLVEKGLNATIEKNDIMVDGFKVASGCGYNIGPDFKWAYDGAQISIYQDIEAIRHICKKPMAKIPKALGDYGFTTEYIADWVSSWLMKEGVEF